jgi:DnaA-homolog protein
MHRRCVASWHSGASPVACTDAMKQIPLPLGPAPLRSLSNFVLGLNAAAVELLRDLPLPAPPVYLWGPAGSGKTHLLHALAQRCLMQGQPVGWFDAGLPQPWSLQPDWVLVVIDGCDRLQATEQQAVFALFVEAATHGVQVAAAGRVPPVDLPLREDLRTRLGWGHVVVLHPLSDEHTRAALRLEAERRGFGLSDEVMNYLLTRFPRDLAHLMPLFDQLDQFALSLARPVTVPLLRQMLAESACPSAPAAHP